MTSSAIGPLTLHRGVVIHLGTHSQSVQELGMEARFLWPQPMLFSLQSCLGCEPSSVLRTEGTERCKARPLHGSAHLPWRWGSEVVPRPQERVRDAGQTHHV